MRKLRTLLALFVASVCSMQSGWSQDEETPNPFESLVWNELSDYPITLSGEGWTVDGAFVQTNIAVGASKTLYGHFSTDKDAVLTYVFDMFDRQDAEVYVDGKLVFSLDAKALNDYNFNRTPCYVALKAGEHDVEWRLKRTSQYYNPSLKDLGVIATPEITVNLLEPGSLGTEVLYHVDNIKDVRNLKIIGKMNDEDWAKIDLMDNLFVLDLSDADITKVPAFQFGKFISSSQLEWYHATAWDRKHTYLNKIVLPEKLETIGDGAFRGSFADVEIPSNVSQIGAGAFSGSRITKANLVNVETINAGMFDSCPLLKEICLSSALKSVGQDAFRGCKQLTGKLQLATTLEFIGQKAFTECGNANFRFPDNYLKIERDAFHGTGIDSLILHRSWSTADVSYSYSPFLELNKLVYVEIPIEVPSMTANRMLEECPNLSKIVLKSPTKVSISNTNLDVSKIALVVPSHLVNAYKLDSYWYNAASIEGFSTEEIKDWLIQRDLTLNGRERLEGTPNVELANGITFKVNGDNPQSFNNFTVNINTSGSDANYTKILGSCDYVSIEGNAVYKYYTNANEWYYITLPFDTKVEDIYNNNAAFAVRYYDGAARAENGTGNSWKNFAQEDIIHAGTGFIFQTSKTGWVSFKAQENDAKKNIFSNEEISTALIANVSENPANKGWNLVGNPWLTYYNIHKLNFTAPITVWNGKGYTAYSIIDDDYAIKPNEAFFVQCPDEVTEISFPIDGRQLTSVIESQNASRRQGQPENKRRLLDLEVANGDLKDKTRVVLNEQASLAYEPSKDASKFMSMDGDVPQIYTIDADGNEYAINERPMDNGTVKLRLSIPKAGTYTISAVRNNMKQATLKDLLTGETVDLMSDACTVELEAGTYAERFELVLSGNAVTEIKSVEAVSGKANSYYNLNGQRVENPAKGVYIVKGKKTILK